MKRNLDPIQADANHTRILRRAAGKPVGLMFHDLNRSLYRGDRPKAPVPGGDK